MLDTAFPSGHNGHGFTVGLSEYLTLEGNQDDIKLFKLLTREVEYLKISPV